MQCPSCGSENPDGYRFCDACGEALVQCSQCGAMGRPGARFCGQCGAHVQPHPLEAGEPTPHDGRDPADTAPRQGNGAAVAADATDYAERAERCATDGHWAEAMEYAARAGAAAGERLAFREA